MATSGNFSKAITSWLTLRVNWVANSQDVTNNRTSLTATAYLISSASSGHINSSASKSITLTINGTAYQKSAAGLAAISGNQTKTLFTKTVNVPHNADGSKNCAISCSFGLNVTLGGSYYGTQTTSGTAALNTIPRASTISSVSGDTIGSAITVNITRASSSFTHKVYYTPPNGSKTLKASSVATSTSFTPALSECALIPNATAGTATITVETLSGTTLIGTKTKTITVKVPSSVVPTVSSLAITEAVAGLAAQFGGFVNGKSKTSWNVTAAGAQGSTIKTYSINILGFPYSGRTGTTDIISTTAGSKTATVTVTDSRGRTASKSTTFNVFEYFAPKFTGIIVRREDQSGNASTDGEALRLVFTAEFAPVNNRNTYSCTAGYRLEGTTGNYTSLPITAFTSPLHSVNNVYKEPTYNFSNDNAFEIRVALTDYFGTTYKTLNIPTGRTVFDILADGTGICFGGVASKSNTAEFQMTPTNANGKFGSNPKILTTGEDLNSLTAGFYLIPTSTVAGSLLNKPSILSTQTGYIIVLDGGTSAQKIQYFIVTDKPPRIYGRSYYSGTWGDWATIYRTPLNGTITAASGWSFTREYLTLNGTIVNMFIRATTTQAFAAGSTYTIATIPGMYCPENSVSNCAWVTSGSTRFAGVAWAQATGNIQFTPPTAIAGTAAKYVELMITYDLGAIWN